MAKTDPNQLRPLLEQCPPAGARFRHYKGGEYVIVGSALLEATLEPVVLYRPLAGDAGDICWARPLAVWNECVQLGDRQVQRFQKID